MKKRQLSITYQLLTFLLLSTILMSCPGKGSDDGTTPDPEPSVNQLLWDGELYDLNDGLYTDLGATPTGYDVELVLAGANLVSTTNEDVPFAPDANGIGHLLGLNLSSNDNQELMLGDYLFANTLVSGQSTFTADWLVDKTGNRELEDSGDLDVGATGGMLTLSGSGTNISIVFELQFGQNTLRGSFNKVLKYNDQRD